MSDSTARIDAIAAKALLLEPGELFTVGVAGDEERALRTCDEIMDAVERQADAAVELMSWQIGPGSFGIAVTQLRPNQHTIVIGRVCEERGEHAEHGNCG